MGILKTSVENVTILNSLREIVALASQNETNEDDFNHAVAQGVMSLLREATDLEK